MENENVAQIATPRELGSNFSRAKDAAEIIGKFGLGMLAVLYALGLIVVNSHLSTYGVYSLSLFRLNYVLAGLWAGTFILVGGLSILSLQTLVPSTGRLTRLHELLDFTLPTSLFLNSKRQSDSSVTQVAAFNDRVAAVLFLFFLVSGLVTGYFFIPDYVFYSVLSFYLFGLVVVMYFGFVLHAWSETAFKPKLLASLLFGAVGVYVVIIYGSLFGRVLYSNIPVVAGGGRPQQVQILFTENSKLNDKLAILGINVTEYGFTNNTAIVLTTDEEYIVLIYSQQPPPFSRNIATVKKADVAVLFMTP